MRRLKLLPCPEAWDRMQPVEGGRWCDRCRLRVTEAAGLDEAELIELTGGAGGRACLRVALEGARPRLASGFAAGVLVAALASCASAPSLEAGPPPVVELAAEPGRITGAVIDHHGQPVAGALVIVQGATPTVERMTDGGASTPSTGSRRAATRSRSSPAGPRSAARSP